MSTERRQVSFRLEPAVHAALKELAGPTPLAEYMEGLVKRLVARGLRQPTEQDHPRLPLQPPQQVQVTGLEKLTEPIAEVRAMMVELLRVAHEHREYEALRDAELDRQGGLRQWFRPTPEVSRKAIEMAARDAAARYLRKWNGGGDG